jgi:predicted nucleic acid-binding protein
MIVLDASVAAAWIFQDEQTPKALDILDLIAKDSGIVPPLWHDELTNVLMVGYRRGRLSQDQVAIFLSAVRDLPIKTADTVSVTKYGFWSQKEAWGLSGYDAAYLHLALQGNIPLATLDQKLAATAVRVGAEVV